MSSALTAHLTTSTSNQLHTLCTAASTTNARAAIVLSSAATLTALWSVALTRRRPRPCRNQTSSAGAALSARRVLSSNSCAKGMVSTTSSSSATSVATWPSTTAVQIHISAKNAMITLSALQSLTAVVAAASAHSIQSISSACAASLLPDAAYAAAARTAAALQTSRTRS